MSKQTFDQVGLNPALLATLDSLNYTHMTPIQALSLPAILKHRDVIGRVKRAQVKPLHLVWVFYRTLTSNAFVSSH